MIARCLAAELLGTAGLLLAIVGSGIVAATDGAASAQLFQHAVVVGAALGALIVTFGSVSGAHFNPAVTAVDAAFGGLRPWLAVGYVVAQLAGAVVGVVVANALFDLPAVAVATTERVGWSLAVSEGIATAGLLVVIFGVARSGAVRAVPLAVGAWLTAAIYATSSTSFANPAVTVARMLTDTYTGIAPSGVPAFLAAQLVGAAAAGGLIAWLFRPDPALAADIVVAHDHADGADRRR